MCKKGAEWKQSCLVANNAWEADGTEFKAQYHVLDRSETFKCLVLIMSYDKSSWLAVDENLWKAQHKGKRLYHILIWYRE